MLIKNHNKCFNGKAKKILISCFCFSLILWIILPYFAWSEGERLQTEVGGFSSNPTLAALLDILLLLGIITCFFISVKVKSFLRDGELASGWTLFSLSFVLLFIAQLISLSLNINLLNISLSIVSLIRLLSIFTLASGIYFMKKVLS